MSRNMQWPPEREPVEWGEHRVKARVFQGFVIIIGCPASSAEHVAKAMFERIDELYSNHDRIADWEEEMTWIFDVRSEELDGGIVPRRVLVGMSMVLGETLGETAAWCLDNRPWRRYEISQN